KVFLRCRTKILGAADGFCARRCEGPCRLIQNRSRTSVVALKSDAAAERSKDQFSRFATKSAQSRHCKRWSGRLLSGEEPTLDIRCLRSAFDPKRTMSATGG